MRFSKIHRWLTKNCSFVVNDDEIIVAQCALYVMLMQLSMKRVFLYWTAWFDQYLDIFLIISSETDRQIVWRRIYEKKNHSWIFRTRANDRCGLAWSFAKMMMISCICNGTVCGCWLWPSRPAAVAACQLYHRFSRDQIDRLRVENNRSH